jgi:hypothetical protein
VRVLSQSAQAPAYLSRGMGGIGPTNRVGHSELEAHRCRQEELAETKGLHNPET